MRPFLATLLVVASIVVGTYYYLRRHDGPPPAADVVETDIAAHSTESSPPPALQPPTVKDPLDAEAREYVRDISALTSEPLPASAADNFVQRDQTIQLGPAQEARASTPRDLANNPDLKAETPITIVRQVDQIEIITADKLREIAASDPTQALRIIDHEKIKDTTVADVLAGPDTTPDTPITIVKKVDEIQPTTVGELTADATLAPDTPIKVLQGRQSLNAATVAELMMHGEDSDADAIYYVRIVNDTDSQGIWGIIQYGLIDNFARGIAIRRGEDLDTYRVDIPRNADERVDGRTSSFLGRMIDEKSRNSHVYNLQQGRMGKNPDIVHPGQELLIIRFNPEELVDIYKHFVNARQG